MNLTDCRTLGHSGLVVSPLALGAMTFGNPSWGSDDDVSRSIFNAYVEAGGNFVDTADVYSGGKSETLLGNFIAERKLRDHIVLATKFAFNTEKGNPHAGGKGRKNIYRALHGSLERLNTDYLDLYWLHVWDMVTPVEEVLQTLGDLVRGLDKYVTSAFRTCPPGTPPKPRRWRKPTTFPAPLQCRWNTLWLRAAPSPSTFPPPASAVSASRRDRTRGRLFGG